MNILLVEDDKMLGEALEQGLHDQGCSTDWVTDGLSALDSATNQDYDCMLLDLRISGLDGMSVLDTLKKNDYSRPVIIITARDDHDIRKWGLSQGAEGYLVKPFALCELMACIHDAIGDCLDSLCHPLSPIAQSWD